VSTIKGIISGYDVDDGRVTIELDKATLSDSPLKKAFTRGGIDLNTTSGMQWKVSKDGQGVEMNVDSAMVARIQHEGIDFLSPVIFKVTPVTNVWSLAGLKEPVRV